MEESYGTVRKELVLPVQKFNRDLAEIGEISPRLARSRRDLYCRRDLDEISVKILYGYA